MTDMYKPGTGIGRTHAAFEQAVAEMVLADYEGRQKKGFPCGTHTIARKRPQDETPGWHKGSWPHHG